ncbi:MAG: PAS domain S-box protein [Chloroflexota bacterium]
MSAQKTRLSHISHYYALALLATAILSVASYLTLSYSFRVHNVGEVLIAATEQEALLSPQIALLATELTIMQTPEERSKLRQNLLEASTRLMNEHKSLVDTTSELSNTGDLLPELQIIYSGEVLSVDAQLWDYVQAGQKLAQEQDTLLTPDNPDLRYILAHNAVLREKLTSIIDQYDVAHKTTLDGIERRNTFLLLATQGIVLIATLFIFRPMKRRMQHESSDLRSSEARYRLIAENSTDMISKYSEDMLCTYVSPACQTLVGFTPEELIGRRAEEFVHPDDLPIIANAYKVSLEKIAPLTISCRVRCKNGSYIWLETIYNAIHDSETGSIIGIIASSREFTKRKQVEDALHESQRFIQRVAEASPDLIYVYDVVEHRMVYSNRVLGRVLGYEPEQKVMDMALFQTLAHPDDLTGMIENYQQLATATDRDVIDNEYRMRAPDGSWRWYYSRDVVFARNPDGTVRQILGMAHDITNRKHNEEQIRQQDSLYRTLVYNLPDIGILLFDLNLRYTLVEGPLLERLGFSHDKLLGKTRSEALSPEISPSLLPYYLAALKGEDNILESSFGSIYYHLHFVPVRDEKGIISGGMVVAQDLTERKQVELQRLELAVEREKVVLLANFAHDVSHDLRTPLSVMNVSLYLLRHMSDPQKQIDHIRAMEEQVSRLSKLVDQLLTMSSLDSTAEFTFTSVNMTQLLHEIGESVLVKAQEQQINFAVELQENLPRLNADALQLHKALVNLLDNALCFTPPEGHITLRAALNNNQMIVEVQDTGLGIQADDLPHIFDRFYRADKARSTETGGTGLGLTIVKKVVEMHRGKIEIESTLGEGSLFRVLLPLDGQSATAINTHKLAQTTQSLTQGL